MGVFNVEDYLGLVETQHSSRPKFMAVLRKYLEPVQVASDIAEDMHDKFSIDDGVGAQLDVLGKLLGVSRNYPYLAGSTTKTMNDDQYRMVLRATVAKDAWDGSFHSFADTWNEIFAGQAVDAQVVDNMNMSCTVTISGDFDDDIASLITAGYVFPKPMGVSMTYAVSPQGDRTGSASLNAGANLAFLTGIVTITAQ